MSRAVTGVVMLLFAAVVSIFTARESDCDLGCRTAPTLTALPAFTGENEEKFYPPSAPAQRHVSFPEVRDWNLVRITLSRTFCFGQCPAYRIEIHGDGTVLYEGVKNVVVKGQHRTYMTPDKVRQLVNAFREADYYSLRDDYVGDVFTDAPLHRTSIEIDGQVKQVSERAGFLDGMPVTVSKLEDSIDTLANAQQWIGNPR